MFKDVDIRFQRPHDLIKHLYHPDFTEKEMAEPTLYRFKALSRNVLYRAAETVGFSYDKNLFIEAFVSHPLLQLPPLANRGIFLFRSSSNIAAGDINSGHILFTLKATTAVQTQYPALVRTLSNQLGHLVFDDPKIHINPGGGFYTHEVYRADAFGAEVVGKEQYLDSMQEASKQRYGLARIFNSSVPWQKRVQNVSQGSYRDIMLDNLAEAKKAFDKGQRFDSWGDYISNQKMYQKVQKEI